MTLNRIELSKSQKGSLCTEINVLEEEGIAVGAVYDMLAGKSFNPDEVRSVLEQIEPSDEVLASTIQNILDSL